MEDLQENINIEGENLNNIESDTDIQDKTTFTKEEVEEIKRNMQSNSEKWVQKLISEKKVLETYVEELANVWNNPEHLIELMGDNPKVAQMILEKYYDWEDIEDYKIRIWYNEDYSDPTLIQKKIKEEAKKLTENNLIESKKEDYISKLEMTDEEKTNFLEAFEEIKGLKSFNTKDLTKQFEKAYRLWNDNEKALSKMKNQESIWKNISIGEWNNWKVEKKENWNNEYANFLKVHKI